jgi:hypothetical protein
VGVRGLVSGLHAVHAGRIGYARVGVWDRAEADCRDQDDDSAALAGRRDNRHSSHDSNGQTEARGWKRIAQTIDDDEGLVEEDRRGADPS